MKEAKKQNEKLDLLCEVYSEIKMNTTDNQEAIDNFIDWVTGIDDLRVTWVAEDGTVLYDNDTSAELMKNHNDRPEIQEAFHYGVGEAVRTSDTMNKNTFYYALVLDNGTVLRVATDAQSLWAVFMSSAPIIALF